MLLIVCYLQTATVLLIWANALEDSKKKIFDDKLSSQNIVSEEKNVYIFLKHLVPKS